MKVDLDCFKGFEWGSMTFRVDARTSHDLIWVTTTEGAEEAWKFVARSRGQLFALMRRPSFELMSAEQRRMPPHPQREVVMRTTGELTVFGKTLLWGLMGHRIHRALELLEKK